jgi:hypothetical protein
VLAGSRDRLPVVMAILGRRAREELAGSEELGCAPPSSEPPVRVGVIRLSTPDEDSAALSGVNPFGGGLVQ